MIAAAALMAIAGVVAESLHRRIRRGIVVRRLAAVTALRIALLGAGLATPTLLLAVLKAIGP